MPDPVSSYSAAPNLTVTFADPLFCVTDKSDSEAPLFTKLQFQHCHIRRASYLMDHTQQASVVVHSTLYHK